MAFLHSDLVSIILGKLPVDEQYKQLYFNKKSNKAIHPRIRYFFLFRLNMTLPLVHRKTIRYFLYYAKYTGLDLPRDYDQRMIVRIALDHSCKMGQSTCREIFMLELSIMMNSLELFARFMKKYPQSTYIYRRRLPYLLASMYRPTLTHFDYHPLYLPYPDLMENHRKLVTSHAYLMQRQQISYVQDMKCQAALLDLYGPVLLWQARLFKNTPFFTKGMFAKEIETLVHHYIDSVEIFTIASDLKWDHNIAVDYWVRDKAALNRLIESMCKEHRATVDEACGTIINRFAKKDPERHLKLTKLLLPIVSGDFIFKNA